MSVHSVPVEVPPPPGVVPVPVPVPVPDPLPDPLPLPLPEPEEGLEEGGGNDETGAPPLAAGCGQERECEEETEEDMFFHTI